MDLPPDAEEAFARAPRPPRWLLALVGVACAAIGAGLLALTGLILEAMWSRPEIPGAAWVVLVVFPAIGIPFLFLARHLIIPNKLDDPRLISPATWYVVAGIFFAISGALVVAILAKGSWVALPGALSGIYIARWALLAARTRGRMQSAA